MDLIPLHANAWVELHDDHATVSWPGGIYLLDYEAPVVDLIAVIRLAISDMMAEYTSPDQLRREKAKAFDEGFDAGWKAKHPAASNAS